MKLFSKWFKKAEKKIAFLDGDQDLKKILAAYKKYLIGTETHLIRLQADSHLEPKQLRNIPALNKIYLSGYTRGKEIVDKFIGAYIQKSVQEGYTHITVVSSDFDFIDIFKMAVILNPEATNITFRIIVPNVQGRMCDMPDKVANIEIVKL